MQPSKSCSEFPVHRRPSWDMTRTSSVTALSSHRRTSSVDSVVVNSSMERKPSLQEQLNIVLTDYSLCFDFKEYMKARKCEENLYFWIDIELFKTETSGDIVEQAERIYYKFLADNAEHQVNLDGETVAAITERLKSGNIDRNMFKQCQRATHKLMETACIAGFQRFQEELPQVTSAIKKNPSLLHKIFKLKQQPRTESTKQLTKYFERRPSIEYQES